MSGGVASVLSVHSISSTRERFARKFLTIHTACPMTWRINQVLNLEENTMEIGIIRTLLSALPKVAASDFLSAREKAALFMSMWGSHAERR